MSSFISIPNRYIQAPLTIAISALFLVACSSSGSGSGSSSSDSQSTIDNNSEAPAVAIAPTNNPTLSEPGNTSSDSTNDNPVVVANETQEPTASDPTESTNPTSNQILDDLDTVLTRVDIDITVPVYVSNSLQVRLTWGDTELSAGWEVDETWRVVSDFPSDTENLLNVEFLDRNGAIILGTYETSYRTGTSPSETISIGADQFDTSQWDDDSDGISNLDELIAGTDPLALPGPSIQNLVRVDFGITVPVFVSDELQLLLVWGDEEIEASWAGDESWSAFADLPADTEEPLSVIFSDENGDVTLGNYETTYQTGNNGAEYLQIESRQINTNRFDNDNDGVSNYSELLAETDPNVSDSLVPVTFASIEGRTRGCANCHSNYRNRETLYDVFLSQTSRGGEQMVTPFEPEDSYLVNKLEGSMQRFGGTALPQLVRAWIINGALDN